MVGKNDTLIGRGQIKWGHVGCDQYFRSHPEAKGGLLKGWHVQICGDSEDTVVTVWRMVWRCKLGIEHIVPAWCNDDVDRIGSTGDGEK